MYKELQTGSWIPSCAPIFTALLTLKPIFLIGKNAKTSWDSTIGSDFSVNGNARIISDVVKNSLDASAADKLQFSSLGRSVAVCFVNVVDLPFRMGRGILSGRPLQDDLIRFFTVAHR